MTTPLRPGLQLRVFESETFEFDPAFRRARRVALDVSSWIEHVPGWLSQNDVLFDELARLAHWEQRTRWMYTKVIEEPRLTAEFPRLAEAPSAVVRRIGAALSAHYGVEYDSAWLNLYRDHRDSTSWHADKPPSRGEQAIVPVLSLGETRRFVIRPKSGGRSSSFVVCGGDLIVMGGRCQRDFEHAVPKELTPAGTRISVNFGSSSQSQQA
ncbi:MAG TPA: alpha-ketoglutarate-dependent dioxygenase AlkB [Polyangiales bacterium]|nr:alpha-ketoglutarate-dependent dioxygenase AlkB [Polyangiales bacterium]